MSIYTVMPVIISNHLREERKRNEEQINKKKKEQRERLNNLLLLGGSQAMNIQSTETIYMVKVWHDINERWNTSINGETLEENSILTMVPTIINKCKAKSIQLIPCSADKYGDVDAYLLLMKVDRNNIVTEETLQPLADKMTQEIQTAW